LSGVPKPPIARTGNGFVELGPGPLSIDRSHRSVGRLQAVGHSIQQKDFKQQEKNEKRKETGSVSALRWREKAVSEKLTHGQTHANCDAAWRAKNFR
jgi:hypothetical protein